MLLVYDLQELYQPDAPYREDDTICQINVWVQIILLRFGDISCHGYKK